MNRVAAPQGLLVSTTALGARTENPRSDPLTKDVPPMTWVMVLEPPPGSERDGDLRVLRDDAFTLSDVVSADGGDFVRLATIHLSCWQRIDR